MLGILTGSVIFLGYCLGLTRIKRWPAEAAPLLSISIIVSVLYIFTYFGHLRLGTVLVSIGGILSFLSSPLFIRKQYETIFQDYLTPGFVVGMLLTLIVSVFAASSRTLFFDDFRHWLPHAQAMVLNSGFITNNGYSTNNSYTPGPDLFYYIFSLFKILPAGTIRFAQSILLMSPLALIFSYSKWRNWKVVSGVFAFVIIFYLIICDYPLGIKVSADPGWFAGLCFGAMLLIYYQSKRQWQDIALLLPIVFSFSLMKPMLMPFVLLLASLIVIDQLFTFYKDRQKVNTLSQLNLSLFVSFAMCVIAYAVVKSWDIYLLHANISQDRLINLNFSQLASLLTLHLTQYQVDVLHRILKNAHEVPLNMLPVLFLASLAWYLIPSKIEKNRFLIWQVLLLAGFIAYLFGLVLLFMYGFSDVIMVDFGFTRFTRLYVNGWDLFLFGILYHQASQIYFTRVSFQKTALNFSIFAFVGLFAFWSIQLIEEPKKMLGYQFTNKVAIFLQHEIPANKSVFIKQQGGDGVSLVQITYALLPRTSSYVVDLDSDFATFQNKELKTLYGKYDYLVFNYFSNDKKKMSMKLYKINSNGLELESSFEE